MYLGTRIAVDNYSTAHWKTYHCLVRRVSFLARHVSFLASALQVPYKCFTFC